MKVVVPIKAVARLDDEIELTDDGTALDPDSVEWELNEWDAFSLEQALLLRDAAGGEVIVMTVGDEAADEVLLECLAKGADRSVRVWDEALRPGDPLAVARVLAAAVAPESPDLVLCGVQSSDTATGATGIALAGLLERSHVAVVKALDHDAASGAVTVERELEGGLVEVVRLALPAVVTIQTGINEPRYANLRAIKQAGSKPRAVLGLDDLGLDTEAVASAAGARVRRLAPPERGAGAEMLAGSATEVAGRIAEIVKERMSR